jgi:hypothetical protein
MTAEKMPAPTATKATAKMAKNFFCVIVVVALNPNLPGRLHLSGDDADVSVHVCTRTDGGAGSIHPGYFFSFAANYLFNVILTQVSEFEILLYCCLVLYTGIIYSTTNNF